MNQELDNDMRGAVRDYVDQLISERSARGRGMALSAGDLMGAARAAGQKAYLAELNKSYLQPGVQLIETYSAGTGHTGTGCDRLANKNGRGNRKPMPDRGYKPAISKPKREPHWLTWKTGTTPYPETDNAEPEPSRPPTAAVRPGTAASVASQQQLRATTPQIHTNRSPSPPEPELVQLISHEGSTVPRVASSLQRAPSVPANGRAVAIHPRTPIAPKTPLPSRTPVPPQHTITKETRPLGRTSARQTTPQATQTDRPLSQRAMVERQWSDHTQPQQRKTTQDPEYIPALKTWISNASEYERDVAYNLMQILSTNTSPTPGGPTSGRPKSAGPGHHAGLSRLAAGTRRNVPRTAGVATSHTAAFQQQAYPDWEEYVVLNGDTDTSSQQEYRGVPMLAYSSAPQLPARVRYTTRFRPRPRDVTHQASCFMNAQKPFKSSFTINPEWVSEVKMWKPPQRNNKKVACLKY